jgi:dipeptidyl aminopeptidase/acylaminoacyl peptidase
MRITRALAFTVSFQICATASLAAEPAPELPVETFFQEPAMSGLQFSPNGRRIVCLVPYNDRSNLVVIDLEKGTKNLLTNFNDRSIIGIIWASDDRILFSVDRQGNEEPETYAVNADGSDKSILPFDVPVSLLARLKDDPRHILVQAGITSRDSRDVAKMNLKTGKLSPPIARAPGVITSYTVDRDQVPRVAIATERQTQRRRILYRPSRGGEWKEIASFGFDESSWMPVAFDGDNRTLFVSSDIGRRTRAIYRFDTETMRMESTPVCADDTYDAGSVIYDEARRKVVGFRYSADRERFVWIDPEIREIHARMEASLPDTIHRPYQFSEDGSRIIFYSYSDRDPGVYYLYDRVRKKVSEVGVVNPKVNPEDMAVVTPVSYRARDGLTLHGYLTVPKGREARNLPLIIHPHGGPYGPRDEWLFNPEVQFYANRGFAVLQVNFRGSGGFGYWFEQAGWKKWGLEMQDDLTDGVKWAIAKGIADPERVVISGASYGGYAAMAGLVYTPELYCAGINYVGVVDIEDLVPKGVASSDLFWFNSRIANLNDAADRRRVHETSPVNFAERIQAPVLMAYGRNDPRVRISHAYDIERALKRAGKPYKLIIEEGEGHGFESERKRIAFYKEIDAFLKQHVLVPRGKTDIGDTKVVQQPAETE